MPDPEPAMHFGLNCRHLTRDEYPPADGRCALAMTRYAGSDYAFLDTKTPVPLKEAERFLGLPQVEIIKRAKAGQLAYSFPENVAKRVTIFNKAGEPLQLTVTEAAKRLSTSVAALERQIARGELEAGYPDDMMRIVLLTRWDYERCPLLETGGICCHFQPHDRSKIRCIADAPCVPGGLH